MCYGTDEPCTRRRAAHGAQRKKPDTEDQVPRDSVPVNSQKWQTRRDGKGTSSCRRLGGDR